jgi:hypothetical protein
MEIVGRFEAINDLRSHILGHQHIVVRLNILAMSKEISFYRARIDASNFYSKIADFLVKCIAKTPYGKFGSAVTTHLLVSFQAGDG